MILVAPELLRSVISATSRSRPEERGLAQNVDRERPHHRLCRRAVATATRPWLLGMGEHKRTAPVRKITRALDAALLVG